MITKENKKKRKIEKEIETNGGVDPRMEVDLEI